MIKTPKRWRLQPHLLLLQRLPLVNVQPRTNDPGAVVRDARNEGRNVMNRDLVVEGVKQLMQNVFMKSSYDGVEERLTSPDSGLVFPMRRFLRIR
jgi:hypothetical protein